MWVKAFIYVFYRGLPFLTCKYVKVLNPEKLAKAAEEEGLVNLKLNKRQVSYFLYLCHT